MTCQEVSEEIQEAVNELMEALPEEEALIERLGRNQGSQICGVWKMVEFCDD